MMMMTTRIWKTTTHKIKSAEALRALLSRKTNRSVNSLLMMLTWTIDEVTWPLPFLHIYLFAAHLFHRVHLGMFPFVRVIGRMEYAVRHWADGQRGASIVRSVHEERWGWSAHYKSEESS